MQLTVAAWDDRVFQVELDDNETLSTLQAILEAESNTPAAQQQLVHNGRPLPASAAGQTLSALGIANGDVLMLLQQAPAAAPAQQQRQQQASNAHMALAADGSAQAPAAFIQSAKASPEVMAQLSAAHPDLADAIRREDVPAVQDALRAVRKQQLADQEALRLQEELLEADPFDPEAQAKIEELIHKRNIEENLAAAWEHTPEVFGSVEMLYVNMEVNGVPVKAFVDSGAQMTIMTQNFAAKCHLSRLMDTRFAGMAVGVGSSRILGRIHQTPLKVEGHYTTCSITVLEQKDGPQFIFGLDMLKRHQCVLDLAAGVLRFGSCDATLPFLPDHEIPKDFSRHIEDVSKQQAEKNVEDAAKESAGGAGTSGTAAAADAAPPAAAAAQGGGAAGAGTGTAAAAGPTPMDTSAPPAATPQQPGGANTGAAPGAAAPAGVREADVQQLVGLGFSREMALGALQAAGGDVEAAASMLFMM